MIRVKGLDQGLGYMIRVTTLHHRTMGPQSHNSRMQNITDEYSHKIRIEHIVTYPSCHSFQESHVLDSSPIKTKLLGYYWHYQKATLTFLDYRTLSTLLYWHKSFAAMIRQTLSTKYTIQKTNGIHLGIK